MSTTCELLGPPHIFYDVPSASLAQQSKSLLTARGKAGAVVVKAGRNPAGTWAKSAAETGVVTAASSAQHKQFLAWRDKKRRRFGRRRWHWCSDWRRSYARDYSQGLLARPR